MKHTVKSRLLTTMPYGKLKIIVSFSQKAIDLTKNINMVLGQERSSSLDRMESFH